MTDSTLGVKALLFDVFGTVVDWRSSVINEGRELGRRLGITVDWDSFADAWRGAYQPSMDPIRTGARAWANLDTLHRESLVKVLCDFSIELRDECAIDALNGVWHRLEPWPDSIAGLQRLKQRYTLGTLSNGNIAMLVNMAKRVGLPWDVVLGAEVFCTYKPAPQVYLGTCRYLGLAPQEVMLVAAHNNDLFHAKSHGMRTAFVKRQEEYGPTQTDNLEAEYDFDYVADDFLDLAERLGC